MCAMKIHLTLLGLLSLASSVPLTAAAQREESVLIFENRRVAVAVPPGFSFASSQDEAGLINLNLADSGNKVSLHVVFVPDPEERATQARARKEKMVELFKGFVASSVEQAMRFEELEPRRGAGTYCVFTDAGLVGRPSFPPGEYLHLTAGVKAWQGVIGVFRLFSNDTTSAEYLAMLKLLRGSVEERPVPLR
jgi:hypothetical protein